MGLRDTAIAPQPTQLYPFYFEIWEIQFEADKHEDQGLHEVNEDRSAQANKEMDLQISK